MYLLGKMILIMILTGMVLNADALDRECLSCHQKQQIPTALIYKRYLMKYSTNQRMHDAMYRYLRHPNKAYSIMPSQFFFKFPMKKSLQLSDEKLDELVSAFIQRYDIRKKLRLER